MIYIHPQVMVAQTAPSVRVAIGEEMGIEYGSISTGKMVTALKKLGFDYVFDTNFSADLTIMEEGTELLARLKEAWGHGEEVRGSNTA
jgi:NADP-reducing hydrogenase subunit HndD